MLELAQVEIMAAVIQSFFGETEPDLLGAGGQTGMIEFQHEYSPDFGEEPPAPCAEMDGASSAAASGHRRARSVAAVEPSIQDRSFGSAPGITGYLRLRTKSIMFSY
ncbi:hypothetical protein GCM10007897_19670 [Sphingobium jiangsuense]|nr:hypothetical protein GCM10007897_19670 [Sphingobium jiangsuense]